VTSGLGHAARDRAITRELRRLDSGIEIMWLAGDPARRLIAEAGERLLYHFVGYAFPFDPADYADKKKVRAALGYDTKKAVDAWASTGADIKAVAFGAAQALRWTEIGLNAIYNNYVGIMLLLFGIAMVASTNYPPA
jgi:hypothetical protein